MSDADMVVPVKWWRYTKRLFEVHPKLGVVVPLMTGNGYFDHAQRIDLQRFHADWVVTDEGYEATTPGSDLKVMGQDFPDVNGVWADGFQVIRSSMVKELGRWSGEREFRDNCSKRGWFHVVCAGFIVQHDKNGVQIG